MAALAFVLAKYKVSNLAAQEAFYTDVFGFTVVARIDAGEGEGQLSELILGLPGGQPQFALIHYPNQPAPKPGAAVVVLMVADLEGTLKAVEAAGGRTLAPIVPVPEYNLKIAYVTDPEGHILELTESTGE